jgi:2-polyprenyl-3-methyl-5-hydroxy-6-metoxy-1,4-benzoquinol methylase
MKYVPTSQTFWNNRAKKYDAKLYKGPNYAARLERAAAVFGDNANVLDVGCATGEITLDLAQHASQILGIDHAPDMADAANAKARERNIDNARFESIDATDPSLIEGSFDAITNYSLLHLIEDPPGGPGAPATVARFHELLKPGGHLLAEAPVLGDWNPFWRILIKLVVTLGICPKITALKLTDLESMVTAPGFDILDSKVHNPKSGMHCILARKR